VRAGIAASHTLLHFVMGPAALDALLQRMRARYQQTQVHQMAA
jgi:hypothetical protein